MRIDIAMAFENLDDLEVIADIAEYDDIVVVGKAADSVAKFRARSSDVPGERCKIRAFLDELIREIACNAAIAAFSGKKPEDLADIRLRAL
ncbi:hypothetical protein FHT82_005253 [Rhizobium sp. BK275]|nr:hypothetical protein [Rhizobium sp. BK275]MBB3408711.1 hypothetical protein [Rhizobium sp. BK316]